MKLATDKHDAGTATGVDVLRAEVQLANDRQALLIAQNEQKQSLLALARKYSAARLEAACTRAMAIRAPHLRSVTSILKCGLDSQPALFTPAANPVIEHENVRGPDYYH